MSHDLQVMDFGVDEHAGYGQHIIKEGDNLNQEMIKVNDDYN